MHIYNGIFDTSFSPLVRFTL